MKALISLLLLPILQTGCMASAVHGIGESTDFTTVARRAIVGKDGSVAILSEAAKDGSPKRVWAIYHLELLSRLLTDKPNSSIRRSAVTLRYLSDRHVQYVRADSYEPRISSRELPPALRNGRQIDWPYAECNQTIRYQLNERNYELPLDGSGVRKGSSLPQT